MKKIYELDMSNEGDRELSYMLDDALDMHLALVDIAAELRRLRKHAVLTEDQQDVIETLSDTFYDILAERNLSGEI